MKAAFWLIIFLFLAVFIFNLSFTHVRLTVLPKVTAKKMILKIKKEIVSKEQNPFMLSVINEFDGFVNTMIANKIAPGAAVAIVKDTSIIFLKGYGLREYGKPDSINERTVFRVGSVSKSITATLCAALVNDGVLHWDDSVVKYLPNFKLKSAEATKKLTLRHLLSHTEGLPYHTFTVMVDKNAPVDTLIDYLQDLDLIAQPGKIHSYQNVGFSLIGKMIEAVTHKSFEEVLTEKLFRPIEMEDASASFKKITSKDNFARPHQLIRPLKISDIYYSVAPAGGVNASAQDLALWLKAMLSEKTNVLPAARLNEMFQPQVWAPVRNIYFSKWKRVRKPFYGLGWRILTFNNDTLMYHGGFVNNYRCEVALSRKNKIAVAVMVNTPGMLADQAVPKFFTLYDRQADSIRQWKPKPHL